MQEAREYKKFSKERLEVIKSSPVCIYRIISPSWKLYIGQTTDLHKRITKYKNLLCKAQPKLYNSFKKYGFENHSFKVLHTFAESATKDEINAKELAFLNMYINRGYQMLNIREGGGSHGKMSIEARNKMSKARMGKKPWNYKIKTGLEPPNKGKRNPQKIYSFYKNGEEIVVNDLKTFCETNNLTYSAMIEVQSGKGNYGKRGEHRGYTKHNGWRRRVSEIPHSENHPRALFNNNQVKLLRELFTEGKTVNEIAGMYKTKIETMRRILNGKAYKYI